MLDAMSYIGGLLFFAAAGSGLIVLVFSFFTRKVEADDPNWDWTDFE